MAICPMMPLKFFIKERWLHICYVSLLLLLMLPLIAAFHDSSMAYSYYSLFVININDREKLLLYFSFHFNFNFIDKT